MAKNEISYRADDVVEFNKVLPMHGYNCQRGIQAIFETAEPLQMIRIPWEGFKDNKIICIPAPFFDPEVAWHPHPYPLLHSTTWKGLILIRMQGEVQLQEGAGAVALRAVGHSGL